MPDGTNQLGRRSTDTIENLRKLERDLAKAQDETVTWRMAYRAEEMKAANLAHCLYRAEQTIKALLDPQKLELFYEITREKK